MKTLFSNQTGDGTSSPATVKSDSTQSHIEAVMVQGSGGFGGGTLTLEACADPDASPQAWTGLVDAQGNATGAFDGEFCILLDLPSGVAFRAALSGASGASLTVTARGDLR